MKKPASFIQYLRAHPEFRYFLFIPWYIGSFFLMEHLVPSTSDYWVSYCRLDDLIPFCEVFVVPYCLWYPFLLICGLGLMFRDVPGMKRYVWFMVVGFGLSMLFCVLFPNGQDLRPDPLPRDNVFTRLLQGVYAADTNTNVLPSMHIVGCVAGCVGVWRCAALRRWRAPVLIAALLISASTVLVKQHSILDIFAGVALCVPLWFLFYFRKPKKDAKKAE